MMLRTFITKEQELEFRERLGFVDVCQYGTVKPEVGEIGGIYKLHRNGLFTSECIERFFVV